MDTALALDPALPKRRGVEEAIRRAVESGALGVGARLPSARELAEDLGVARGTVVSAVQDKTIVVQVATVKAHPRYKKVVRRSQRFHAHDERNVAKVGDVVRIVETRPVSKLKRWRLAEVVEEAK